MENLANNPINSEQKFVVALSGGIDSVVLLHLYSQYNVRAIHVNHNISPNALQWQEFCQQLCDSLTIDLTIKQVHLPTRSNIEEVARNLRYDAIYEELGAEEILLTAHHKNDQAETVLLNMCRGSGMVGLAGMEKMRKQHYRPLLDVSKTQIVEYATLHTLDYIDDESNTDTQFRRNFMRLQVLPLLETKYPSIVKNIAQVAENSAEMVQLSSDIARIDILEHNLFDDELLRIDKLILLEEYRIKNVIYHHLRTLEYGTPSSKVMQQILNALRSSDDANVHICWGEWEVRIFAKKLYILPQQPAVRTCSLYDKLQHITGFNIRYREQGQRIQFAHKTHSQSVKKLLQEYNIPPWERDNLRMYYINDVLVAIEKIGYIDNKYEDTSSRNV